MISKTDRIETRIYPHREGRPPVVSLCLSAIFVQRRCRGGIRKAFDRVNTPFFDFDFLENKSLALGTSLVCQRFPKNQIASSGGFRTSTNQSPTLILIFSNFNFRMIVDTGPKYIYQVNVKTGSFVTTYDGEDLHILDVRATKLQQALEREIFS